MCTVILHHHDIHAGVTPAFEASTPTSTPQRSSSPARPATSGSTRLPQRAKLVDEHMRWCEQGRLLLADQPAPFRVIGVVGRQGTGKSTILSQLHDGMRLV